MQHFSQEYLEKLIAEHKLVSASYAQLKTIHFKRQIQTHGMLAVEEALSKLATRKVELEAYIDTLTEFLNG